jgi:hypothetical protein
VGWNGGETGGDIDGGSAVMRHCGTVVVDWRGGGRRGTERGVGGCGCGVWTLVVDSTTTTGLVYPVDRPADHGFLKFQQANESHPFVSKNEKNVILNFGHSLILKKNFDSYLETEEEVHIVLILTCAKNIEKT